MDPLTTPIIGEIATPLDRALWNLAAEPRATTPDEPIKRVVMRVLTVDAAGHITTHHNVTRSDTPDTLSWRDGRRLW